MEHAAPVNDALIARLAQLAGGNATALDMLTGYIKTALAVPAAGDLADPGCVHVLGFHVASNEALFTAYFVTPAALIRMEFMNGRSLTITIPLTRVSRVTDEWSGGGLAVTVEFDAQGLAGTALQQPDGASQVVRLSMPTYTITATPGDVNESAIPHLADFSAALRGALI